jgi:hypothetical protein
VWNFLGVVQEVWRHEDRGYFARVFYEVDDDVEDMSIQKLDGLLKLRSTHKRQV